MAITKNTEIKIEVSLDENNIPEHMNWTAEDGGISSQDTKAMLLSFWDFAQMMNMELFFPRW